MPDQSETQSASSAAAMSMARREEIDAAGAGGRIGGDERRLVLDLRIEQEAGTGFDDAAHADIA